MALMFNDRPINSVENNNGRYVQGGLVDVFPNRLGWWNRYDIPKHPTDIRVNITKDTDKRPDLVSNDIYQTPNLAWLVLQYNDIVDINQQFLSGRQIMLPSNQRVKLSILTRSVGGNIVEKHYK